MVVWNQKNALKVFLMIKLEEQGGQGEEGGGMGGCLSTGCSRTHRAPRALRCPGCWVPWSYSAVKLV